MTAKRDVGTGVRLLVGTTTNIMTKWTLLCLAVLAACRVGATVFKIPNESGMDPGADLRRRMEQQRRILRKVEVRPLFTEKNNNFRICSRYEWKRRYVIQFSRKTEGKWETRRVRSAIYASHLQLAKARNPWLRSTRTA